VHLQKSAASLAFALALGACAKSHDEIKLPPLALEKEDAGQFVFSCKSVNDVMCVNNVHMSCMSTGEFLEVQSLDCGAKNKVCDLHRGCIECAPGTLRCHPCKPGDDKCDPDRVEKCDARGDAWDVIDTCNLAKGSVCDQGECKDMCEIAKSNRSYVGCEFYAADLDNAAIDDENNASAQQFAVAVANPQKVPVEVQVEINDAAYGKPVAERMINHVTVPPGALEVFKLPRREVDGSSEHGLNDGTNTAVTSNAFRVTSSHPITAYQFNPLENVHVFSNDASLLVPTSAIGSKYTVNAWPQTIGNSDDPRQDFDPTQDNEDLRAFLTVIGTQDDTHVHFVLGDKVMKVVGAGPIPERLPGQTIDITIGRYDVVNLETEALNADFTGTLIDAKKPVTVFVGSEASDVPFFGDYTTRQCCADHLEEQLIPDTTLGQHFIIARTNSRTRALAAAAFPDKPLGIAITNEPEWVRVLAVDTGTTTVSTTLPPPDDNFRLREGEDTTLRADQDFILNADKPVSVLQAMGSQNVTGIPRDYPGGDPSLILVPPIEQYRRDYIFLTPDKYAFDFISIMAEADTKIEFDGGPLPDVCTMSPADGLDRKKSDPKADYVIYRCQLSFPKVTSGANSRVLAGDQHDGVHTIVADRPVGFIVDGFDRFVSYAYVGGLNLNVIN
jgi:hypothetical protein